MLKLEKKDKSCFRKREESDNQDRLTNLINKINKKNNPDQKFFENVTESLSDFLSDATKDIVDSGSLEIKRLLDNLSIVDKCIQCSESNENIKNINFFNNREYKLLEKYLVKSLAIINQINQNYR